MIKENYKVWVFYIVIILFCILMFGSGYFTHMKQIQKQNGISFYCNEYTSRNLNRNGCEANITMPYNISINIKSNFDVLKITT